MATTETDPVNCVLCKTGETEETPFMAFPLDCLCTDKTKNIHLRCAKMYKVLHESIIQKYAPGFTMCRECNKYLSSASHYYTQGTDTITVNLELADNYMGWQPHEESRPDKMRSSGHYLNQCIKYTYKTTGLSKREIWYFPLNKVLGADITKPLLMKYWYTDQRGKQGKQVTYYTNGNMMLNINWKNNAYDGEYIEYGLTGRVRRITNYKQHSIHGLVQSFNDKGELVERYNAVDGQRHGLTETWFSEDPTKKQKEWYYDRNKNDYSKHLRKWLWGGQIEEEYIPIEENGKKLVHKKWYYSNGQKEVDIKCIYDANHVDKLRPIQYPFSEYYSNGLIRKTFTRLSTDKIQVETFYTAGKKNELYYINDRGYKNGLYMSWHSTGGREILCSYKNGNNIDEYGKWEADGTLVKFGKYDDGKFRHVTLEV